MSSTGDTGAPASRTPSLKLRLVGAFCLVAGVLSIVGAITGWDVRGGTPRPALWIVGIVLLLVSAPCLVVLRPKVASAGADADGVTIELRSGAREDLPWQQIAAVTLKGVGAPPHTGGWVLDLQAASPALGEHRGIGRWAAPRGTRPGHLVVAVPAQAGRALDAALRRAAGPRYTPDS